MSAAESVGIGAPPSDQELVRRAKRGDRAAFDFLMERYQREVITVAHRMLGNFEDALDVAQEAFFRVYRGLSGFREEAAFRTWLYQITLNLSRHRRRWYARHRVGQTVSIDEPESEETDDPIAERLPGRSPDPREQYAHRELREKIAQALEKLPEPLRAVVILRDIQGLAYEEIAAACREQVGTVKSRLHRGRAMLRQLLRGIK